MAPRWNPLTDCWQAIFMLITCLQLCSVKDFVYQHLNSKQLKKEKIGKIVRSHSQIKSFTLQRLLKWPHSLVFTDTMPRCCYFHLDLSLIRAKTSSLFSLWWLVNHHGVSVLNSNILGSFRRVPTVSHKQIKSANYHEGSGKMSQPSPSWNWDCH